MCIRDSFGCCTRPSDAPALSRPHIRRSLWDVLFPARADPARFQRRDVKQVMSVGVADKFRRLVAHAEKLEQWPAVALKLILAEHVLPFEPDVYKRQLWMFANVG